MSWWNWRKTEEEIRLLIEVQDARIKLHHTIREFEMATQATIDALGAATTQLDKSTDASIAATEALVNAAGGDDSAIQGLTTQIVAATAKLDAETAKVVTPAQP